MRLELPGSAALVLIDLQRAIDDASWGVRNNPQAETRGALVLTAWRASGRAVFHVKHDSVEPGSTYRPGQAGNDFKPEFVPEAGETVIAKQTCNAFVRTGLAARLDAGGHRTLAVFGVITNNSVEATVRHAGCLGYRVFLVEDACFTFGRRDWAGRERTGDEVHAMSLANLDGEYCTVVESAAVLASI